MRQDDDDRDLRARFAALREADQAAAAPFDTLLGAAERRQRRHSLAPRVAAIAAALVLIAGGALSIVDHHRRMSQRAPATALVRLDLRSTWWRAPTDFLLDTPGDRLLRTVPALGSADDWNLPPAHTPRSTPHPSRKDGRITS